jgi:hypothetical protein
MASGWKARACGRRTRRETVRLRPEVEGGEAFEILVARLASKADGLDREKAAWFLRHLGRPPRRSAA